MVKVQLSIFLFMLFTGCVIAQNNGVDPVDTLNPYIRVEAETMSSSWGIKLDVRDDANHYVTSVHNGDWIKLRNVDFGAYAPIQVTLEILHFKNEGMIEFYKDIMEGEPFARIAITNDNSVFNAPIQCGPTGIHDVYILFRGADEELFDFDWWKLYTKVNMPLIQTKYTADPAPMVYNDTIFLYTTHDADTASGFDMVDWLLYTSTDMVNWTDHGAVASLSDFKYHNLNNGAWAEHVVYRNGKFYMYCPIHGHGIGVLVSESPYGPFIDPIGKPLVWQKEHWNDIDPTVYIDDETGEAYMYWGNPEVYWAKLNDDMVSLKSDIHKLDYHIDYYQEGPWLYKREGFWYLAFASTCCPEGIGYAMSNSPEGPWKPMGHIMDRTNRTRGNHPGIIDYKGKSYVFGLNYDIMHLTTYKHHERRSVSAAEISYNADGTIQKVPYWMDAELSQIEWFNPYQTVQAETMAWGYGLKTVKKKNGNIYVNDVDDGEYIKLAGVDFGVRGPKLINYKASSKSGGIIEVRIDNPDGQLIGTIIVNKTGGDEKFRVFSTQLASVCGVHDLFFVFHGESKSNIMTLDRWDMLPR